jgi:hypothetical protein
MVGADSVEPLQPATNAATASSVVRIVYGYISVTYLSTAPLSSRRGIHQ